MKKVVLIIGMMLFALGIVRGQSTGTVENMQQGTTEQVQIEEFVPKVIIEGKWGTGAGEFGIQHGSGIEGDDRDYSPNSIAVDSKGNIYILDMVNNRIQKFNSEGKYLLSIQVDSWKGETRIWHDKIVYNEYLGDNIPSIRPNSAKGINIVIDSDDVLYYYLVREKENKGEVWQFKNDKLVKKWEAPVGQKGLEIKENKLYVTDYGKMIFVKNISDFINASFPISFVISIPNLYFSIFLLFKSKPTTFNTLENATASGSPTYPNPITDNFSFPLQIFSNNIFIN